MTNLSKGLGPTVTIRPDCERAKTWRHIFGSTTAPIKSTTPRPSFLPGIGPRMVFDVDVARLDDEQVDRAAKVIAERFGMPVDVAMTGIRGEHGIPLLADDVAFALDVGGDPDTGQVDMTVWLPSQIVADALGFVEMPRPIAARFEGAFATQPMTLDVVGLSQADVDELLSQDDEPTYHHGDCSVPGCDHEERGFTRQDEHCSTCGTWDDIPPDDCEMPESHPDGCACVRPCESTSPQEAFLLAGAMANGTCPHCDVPDGDPHDPGCPEYDPADEDDDDGPDSDDAHDCDDEACDDCGSYTCCGEAHDEHCIYVESPDSGDIDDPTGPDDAAEDAPDSSDDVDDAEDF